MFVNVNGRRGVIMMESPKRNTTRPKKINSSATHVSKTTDKKLFKCRAADIMPTKIKPRPKGTKDNVLHPTWFRNKNGVKSRSSRGRSHADKRHYRKRVDSSDYDDYDDDILDEELSDPPSEVYENDDWRPAWNSSTKLAPGLKQRLEGRTRRNLRLVEENIRAEKKAAARKRLKGTRSRLRRARPSPRDKLRSSSDDETTKRVYPRSKNEVSRKKKMSPRSPRSPRSTSNDRKDRRDNRNRCRFVVV